MKNDRMYIEHVLHCIARVERYTSGGKEEFLGNEMVQDAAIRNLQILAESTRRISGDLKKSHPEVPWRAIAGFRNVAAHDYLALNLKRIWKIISHDLPELKKQMEYIARDAG